MVKSIWRLSENLIYHVLYIESPEILQTNFTITSLYKVSLSIQSPYQPFWQLHLPCFLHENLRCKNSLEVKDKNCSEFGERMKFGIKMHLGTEKSN